MLGTTRLHSVFGAARKGFNTAGDKKLTALLRGYAHDGLSLIFISPDDKRPLDPRTDSVKKKEQAAWEAEGNTGMKPAGYYLATSDPATLTRYMKELRKRFDGKDRNVEAGYGLTPLNFGLVPNQSRVVIFDCDTVEENNAFRNFYMDHTANVDVWENIDTILPSVTSPGRVDGGEWTITREAMVFDDYGTETYVPEEWQNTGGRVAHAGGGHWYFFYPEGYELPESVRAKPTITYDSTDRAPYLHAIREAKARGTAATTQEEYDKAVADYNNAVAALQAVQDAAREDYHDLDGKSEKVTQRHHFAMMLHSCYVIIPPSSRKEGHYEVRSGDHEWEQWIYDLINEYTTNPEETTINSEDSRDISALTFNETAVSVSQPGPAVVAPAGVQNPAQTKYTNEESFAAFTASVDDVTFSEAIEHWAWTQAWEQILTPEEGWIRQPTADRCGCEIFTAPGTHSSPKSVTAHVGSCSLGCSDSGRLHIWTDNPPEEFMPYLAKGKRDFSKLSALAILQYDGNVGKAIQDVGIKIPALSYTDLDDLDFIEFLMNSADKHLLNGKQGLLEMDAVELIPFDDAIKEPPPVYFVEDTLEEDSFNAIIGAPGSGKSFIAIDLAGGLVTGTSWMGKRCRKMNVTYFAGEGRMGVIDRFRAWQKVRGNEEALLGKKLFIASHLPNFSMYSAKEFNELADKIKETNSKVVFIDTWSRANAGADENSAEATSATIATLNAMQRRCGCTIIVLHHTRKDSDSARGSSALNGALDTEVLVKKVEEDPDPEQNRRLISVEISKQKNAEPWPEVHYCQIAKEGEDSILYDPTDEDHFPTKIKAPAAIADLNGNFIIGADDPELSLVYTMENVSHRIRHEVPDIEIYKAIDSIVAEHPGAGITRSELVKYTIAAVSPKDPNVYPSTNLRRQITAALDAVTVNHMIKQNGNKYQRMPQSRYKSPEAVLKIVEERDKEIKNAI